MAKSNSADSQSLRITRLGLTNWRNFKSVDVRLAKRAFFVGPNAAGKSNLLDSLRFLHDVASASGGGLQQALKRRDGFSAVRCIEARNPSHVELKVSLGTDAEPNIWRYALRFQKSRKQFDALVEQETVRGPNNVSISRREKETSDPFIRSQTLLEQVSQNKDFRPVAQFFQSIRYLHVVPQVIRDPLRARVDIEDPHGGDLLKRISDTVDRTRDARLRRISSALQIAVPQFKSLRFAKDSEGRPHIEAAYAHWRPNATWHREDKFSDGTLRLFGFLWSLGDRGGPLLLEEPELSLNDAVAEQIPRMIARMQRSSGRQVIATTHSMAVLRDEGIGFDEVHELVPSNDGTKVSTASDQKEILDLVEDGAPLSEVVFSRANPRNIAKLASLETE